MLLASETIQTGNTGQNNTILNTKTIEKHTIQYEIHHTIQYNTQGKTREYAKHDKKHCTIQDTQNKTIRNKTQQYEL